MSAAAAPAAPRVLAVTLALWLPAVTGALLLVACASAPKQPAFYREDGPPERVPPDLLATPDAVPRDDPLNPNANRPYVALGRTYVPDTSNAPFRQRGIASWYGRQFQGNRTASGEPYNMFAMTAAHPTLPIPSYARVTNTRDGRSVIVRINDRGPFLHDRIIDLSYAAAARLGLTGAGSGEVEVERILPTQITRAGVAEAHSLPSAAPAGQGPTASLAASAPAGQGPTASLTASAPAGQGPTASLASPAPTGQGPGVRVADAAVAFAVAPPSSGSGGEASPPSAAAAAQAPTASHPSGLAAAEGPTASHPSPAPAGEGPGVGAADPPAPSPQSSVWSVQLGAFRIAANAEALRDRLALLLNSPDASSLPAELRSPRIESRAGLSRVLVGQAAQRAVAQQWSRLLERYLARPTALFAH